jgi:hypothetical protein
MKAEELAASQPDGWRKISPGTLQELLSRNSREKLSVVVLSRVSSFDDLQP